LSWDVTARHRELYLKNTAGIKIGKERKIYRMLETYLESRISPIKALIINCGLSINFLQNYI